MRSWKDTLMFGDDYGYLNARLGGEWGYFYPYSFFYGMADKNLEELEQIFLSSPYSSHYRKELATSETSVLERIKRSMAAGSAEKFRKMKNWSPEEGKILMPIISIRADIYNGRALIRKYHSDRAPVTAPKWHDYGFLGGDFFDEIWREGNHVAEAIELCYRLGSPAAFALSEALDVLQSSGNLAIAERSYLKGLLSICYGSLKRKNDNYALVEDYLGRTVDLWNLLIWFRRNSGDSAFPVEYLDGGALLSVSRLEESKTIKSLLRNTQWMEVSISEEDRHSEVGRILQDKFFRWQISQRRKSFMGIGVAMAYMARQIVEWRNMELLAVGLAAELSPERIRTLLWKI
ncbi:MAG: V-type ATPase subunit [Synergistota bacterium]|nr:V-type ATPase subunit [Synergistota bacterium]